LFHSTVGIDLKSDITDLNVVRL